MNTLFVRLSLALLLIMCLLGTCFFFIQRFSTQSYYEELTQRLNAPIAMYVTGERDLIIDGRPDTAGLQALARQAMVINPTAEVYLLDADGRILGHTFPPETVVRTHVDLEPIAQLASGEARLPLRGTDPRNPDRRKVFSASEIRDSTGRLQGFLYVILGGRKFDELATSIRGSYTQELTLWALLIVVVAALSIGILVVGLLTRRLAQLGNEVRRYSDADFDSGKVIEAAADRSDEIGQLRNMIAAMSSRIRDQFERLRETDRLRRDLISNVSHDLRTPLASMQGYVETMLIKDTQLSDDERRSYLQITRKHTQRLSRLISDLFELSKLESAGVTPRFESFDLAELLQDTVQEFALDAAKHSIVIDISTSTATTVVYADIGLVQRVLENLIKNALKFTAIGGRIAISVADTPQRVGISVADTGCGIPDSDLPHIFDRFYRREEQSQSPFPSSGLGLAIVKRILDLHGSRITVKSEPQKGTRFEFDLPKRRAA